MAPRKKIPQTPKSAKSLAPKALEVFKEDESPLSFASSKEKKQSIKEELSKKAPSAVVSKLGILERNMEEMRDEIESLSSKRNSPSSGSEIKLQKNSETIQKPIVYKYYRLLDSSEETDANDKRAFFRIWESGDQYHFDINPENQNHLALIQRSDSYLKDCFDYKNLEGNKIKTNSIGTLTIQNDGSFKIIKNSEIETV